MFIPKAYYDALAGSSHNGEDASSIKAAPNVGLIASIKCANY